MRKIKKTKVNEMKLYKIMRMTDFFSKQCCLGSIGLILAGFGTLFAVFWLDFLETQIINELKLAPDTRTYDMWKSPPLDMSIEIYLFNWTNYDQFHNHSVKPIVEELGPYVFREKPDKVNIVWHPENSTVSFGKLSVFHFDAERRDVFDRGRISCINHEFVDGPSTAAVLVPSNTFNFHFCFKIKWQCPAHVWREEGHLILLQLRWVEFSCGPIDHSTGIGKELGPVAVIPVPNGTDLGDVISSCVHIVMPHETCRVVAHIEVSSTIKRYNDIGRKG
uniref:Uncharacterized protein n=1 Tax=Phlebotomus papatasi TaxID=29031 RepID=A0A1B0GM35_PHLPP